MRELALELALELVLRYEVDDEAGLEVEHWVADEGELLHFPSAFWQSFPQYALFPHNIRIANNIGLLCG